jgi:hypothetical protein
VRPPVPGSGSDAQVSLLQRCSASRLARVLLAAPSETRCAPPLSRRVGVGAAMGAAPLAIPAAAGLRTLADALLAPALGGGAPRRRSSRRQAGRQAGSAGAAPPPRAPPPPPGAAMPSFTQSDSSARPASACACCAPSRRAISTRTASTVSAWLSSALEAADACRRQASGLGGLRGAGGQQQVLPCRATAVPAICTPPTHPLTHPPAGC